MVGRLDRRPLGLSLAWTAIGLIYEVTLVANRGQAIGKVVRKIKISREGRL